MVTTSTAGVPHPQTVDALLRVIDLNLRVSLLLVCAAIIAGGLFTPLVLLLTGAVTNALSLVPFGGGGASAVGALPIAAYLKWHGRRYLCADYRRQLTRRRKAKSDDAYDGFDVETQQFWALYGEIWKTPREAAKANA